MGTTVMGGVLPRFENHVRLNLDVKDAWGIPALHAHVNYTENEHAMARDAVDTISQLFSDAGLEVIHRNPVMNNPGRGIHELGT